MGPTLDPSSGVPKTLSSLPSVLLSTYLRDLFLDHPDREGLPWPSCSAQQPTELLCGIQEGHCCLQSQGYTSTYMPGILLIYQG